MECRETVNASSDRAYTLLQEYQECMDENWRKFKIQESLQAYHNSLVTRLFSTSQHVHKPLLVTQIDRYFEHIIELFENVKCSNSGVQPPVCVSISENVVNVGVHKNPLKGFVDSNWVINGETGTAITTFPTHDKKSGDDLLTSCLFALDRVKQNSKELETLLHIFRRVRLGAQEVTGEMLDKIMVVIPSWYRLEQHIILRKLANDVGFRRVNLVHETALAAHIILCSMNTNCGQICTISEGYAGISIEIFCKTNNSCSKLVGLASFEWYNAVPNVQEKRRNGGFQFNKFFNSYLKSTKQAESIEDKYASILIGTYNKAVEQLTDKQKKARLYSYFPTASCLWKKAYSKFLCVVGEQIQDFQVNEENLLLNSCLGFAKSTSPINDYIIDHTFPISGYKFPLKNAPNCTNRKHDSALKQRLLEVCKEIRDDLSGNKIHLGPLLQKVVIHIICNAELVLMDEKVTNDDITSQYEKLYEVISTNKFNIQI